MDGHGEDKRRRFDTEDKREQVERLIKKERKISLPNLVKINAEDLIQKTGENKKKRNIKLV